MYLWHNHSHRAQQTASTPTCVNSFQWRLITTVWKAACPVLLAKLCYVFHYCNTGSHYRVIISHFCNHSHVAYNNGTRTHARHELIIFNVHDGVHFSLLHIVVISLYCIRYRQHSHTCILYTLSNKLRLIIHTTHTEMSIWHNKPHLVLLWPLAPVSCAPVKFATVYCYSVYFCLLHNKHLQVDQTADNASHDTYFIKELVAVKMLVGILCMPWHAHLPCSLCPTTTAVIMWQCVCTYSDRGCDTAMKIGIDT